MVGAGISVVVVCIVEGAVVVVGGVCCKFISVPTLGAAEFSIADSVVSSVKNGTFMVVVVDVGLLVDFLRFFVVVDFVPFFVDCDESGNVEGAFAVVGGSNVERVFGGVCVLDSIRLMVASM